MTNPVQHFEDRVSRTPGRTNRKTAIRHPVGCGRGYNLLRAQIAGTEAQSSLYWPMGANLAHSWPLQQAGKAARLRPDKRLWS